MWKRLAENLLRGPVTDPPVAAGGAALAELADLGQRVDRAARQRLGRSLAIREIDAGSCNGCELEINALNNAVYDLERFGIRFVASPRHADVLLVTGPVTWNMREALERTVAATPEPRWVVAVGDCAFDGGLFAGSYACVGGVGDVVPVDLHIRGCPPSPTMLLKGLLALLSTAAAAPGSGPVVVGRKTP
jgi:Ni,Fe-hydrogenase III small subunit